MKIKRRNKKIDKLAKDISDSKKEKRNSDAPIEFFPTGSTNLNLTFCGRYNVGWPRARVSNIVGDGSSGKTLLSIEGCFNFLKYIPKLKSQIFPKVKKTRAIYNNREGVLDFPLKKMYGEKFVKSLELRSSQYMENLGADIVKTIKRQKEGTAIIYIADSWDAFRAIAEAKRFEESVKKEDSLKGSYNQEKNVYSQSFFEEICYLLENNTKDFTLFIISQTRQKIGVTFGKKQYRAGGAALDFYTHLAVWLREIEKVSKKKHGEERIYAIESEAKVERSKIWKPFRKSKFRILYDHGVDDIGGMLTYLKDRKKSKWKGFSLNDPQKFIRWIEKNNYEEKLQRYIYRMWNKIEREFEKEVEERKQKEL